MGLKQDKEIRSFMKKGFSLIEVLLIVAIVAITFAGVMALTQKILQMENVVKNDFIAEGLLREGVELVKAVKNENVSSSLPYYTDLITASPATGTTYMFALDWQGVNYNGGRDSQHIYAISGAKDSRAVMKVSGAPYYQLATGNQTPFYRYFNSSYLSDSGARNYLYVDVVVYWEERGKGHTSHLHTKIFGE